MIVPPPGHAEELAAVLLLALERPGALALASVGACAQILRTPGLSVERYEQAMATLAGVAYGRPDLVRDDVAEGLRDLVSGAPPPATTCREAGELLQCLLATPAARRAIDVIFALLARPDRPTHVYQAMLRSLDYAAFWTVGHLDLASFVGLTEQPHLAPFRDSLLHVAIERALFATPTAVTPDLLERLDRLYGGHPSWRYCLAYLAARTDVSAAARRLAAAGIRREPPRASVAARLGHGAIRVLMVQNIKDGQGDEIIRSVPLLQAFLSLNPRLRVVLVTARPYLYAHPRITRIPIEARADVEAALAERYDAVIDFFEPDVPQVNHDLDLEDRVQASLRVHWPYLFLASSKGWGHFVYQRVDVEARPYADSLGLDRQRVANNYETTFRLIFELGLPLRLGEEPPPGGAVLAGLPCPEADAAWSALVAGNTDRRPIVLIWPFGGKPLKGYVERQFDDLVDRIRALIAEGYFVVVQPNGMPWGSAAHARRVVDRLDPTERASVVLGPDPADGAGLVTHQSPDALTVPYASYVMHLVTYFVGFADLVVTVEGWMMHAAYCLGRPFRVLMLPHSPPEWFPYGRTIRQEVAPVAVGRAEAPRAESDAAPPLSEQPRKHALLLALRGLAWVGEDALPFLRRALRSEDNDVRLAAVTTLSRFGEAGIDADLAALLDDRSAPVRALAADVLLARGAPPADWTARAWRDHLLAHRAIGKVGRDWGDVLRIGPAAAGAVRVALEDDDPVIRREAGTIVGRLDRDPPPRGRLAQWWAAVGQPAMRHYLDRRRSALGG